MFWTAVFGLLVVYVAGLGFGFLRHRSLARETGLPYILFPFSEQSVIYLSLFETRWVPYVVNRWLPCGLVDYIHSSVFKYRWTVKDRLCKKYGGVYMVATPTTLFCNVSDASVVSQVCMARHSFPKPVKQYEAFAMYGPSVFTSEGSQWSYHHRYTAAAFNDKNNALVWQESIRQATEMVDYWVGQHSRILSHPEFVLPDAREDILKLTLNIICSAGFGVKLPFKPAPQATTEDTQGLFKDAVTPPPGYHFTFRSVMEYMNKCLTSVFVANGILPKWIPRAMVPFFETDFKAHEDLGNYLRALIAAAGLNESHTHNLLERLVRSRREEQEKGIRNAGTASKRDPGLSDAEILGNLYIFTLAGHETTATTLRFALVLLALHQDTQDELYEDIQTAVREEPLDSAEWDYTRIFPKLVTSLCIMLETLRLYPPVVSIPKWTANSAVNITYHDRTYHIPPKVRVNLNANGLHYSEKYWGPDAPVFNPRRWDKRNLDSFLAKNDGVEGLSGPGLEYESIHKPVRGSFIPFSDGLRACMGKKFAQVEFVATLLIIFRDYRVKLAKVSEHETEEDTRRRAEQALQESSTFLTLAIRDEVPLFFQKRHPSGVS